MEEFLETLRAQFEYDIVLTEDSVLGEVELFDSLTSFMILDVIKEKYGISIQEIYLKSSTLKEVFDTIKNGLSA